MQDRCALQLARKSIQWRTPRQARAFILSCRNRHSPSQTLRNPDGSCRKLCRNAARTDSSSHRSLFSTTAHRHSPPVPLNSPEAEAAQSYCMNLLRRYDSPSYTLSHFIPPAILPAYAAIRAFNIEVSRIPDIVSNTTIGRMRHQFWRDTINSTFAGNPPDEPVAVLLGSYLHSSPTKARLNKSWFMKIVSARETALSNPGFTNLPALETYAESTTSTLLYLTLSAIPLHSLAADHIASHIGKAAGIATVLRGVPLLAFPPPPNTHSANPPGLGLPVSRDRPRIVNLPLDVMNQCGVREEDIFRNGGSAEGLRDAIFDIATRASDHLITARTLLKDVKAGHELGHEFEHASEEGHEYALRNEQGSDDEDATRDERLNDIRKSFGIMMGPAVATQSWLDKLQKVDFDIFHSSLRTTDWKLPAIAWWKNRKGEF